MAVIATPVFVQNPKLALAKITPADTTTLVTLVTPDPDGSKVVGINVVDGGGDNPVLTLWVTRSAVDYWLVTVTVPTLSGADGTTPAFDLFGSVDGVGAPMFSALPVDNDGQAYLFLNNGDALKASVGTTLGTGDVHLAIVYGDF